MKEILWELRFVIIAVLAIIIYSLMTWKETKSRLYALMLQAKRRAKDEVLKSGQQQEEWVVKKALQFLPLSVRLLFGEDVIRGIVRMLYKSAKDYLDDGKINNSI